MATRRNDENGLKELLDLLARFLRLAWSASNARERNWHLFTVRQEYVRGMAKTPFDLAVHYVQTHLSDKMADLLSCFKAAKILTIEALNEIGIHGTGPAAPG